MDYLFAPLQIANLAKDARRRLDHIYASGGEIVKHTSNDVNINDIYIWIWRMGKMQVSKTMCWCWLCFCCWSIGAAYGWMINLYCKSFDLIIGSANTYRRIQLIDLFRARRTARRVWCVHTYFLVWFGGLCNVCTKQDKERVIQWVELLKCADELFLIENEKTRFRDVLETRCFPVYI